MKTNSEQLVVSEDILWQAVLKRDANFNGILFYGVYSTGIYCRPICPSRKPNRQHVRFFSSATEAEAANFRPCKRCHPQREITTDSITAKVLVACQYLEKTGDRIPTLAELGERVNLSPSHLQRLFKQRIGISPFQYADALRSTRLKQHLRSGIDIASALYITGYGSSSRLYEKAPKQLGMTPATYQKGGRGKTIRYAISLSALGYLLVAKTDVGLCSVKLGETEAELERELKQEFPQASLQSGDRNLQETLQLLVDYLGGVRPWMKLPLDVRATAFQRRVWDILQKIPEGATMSYSEVAEAIAQPKAVRAVGRACATNPVALAIPCHRVIAKNGSLGGYRWGGDRKQMLLDLEKRKD